MNEGIGTALFASLCAEGQSSCPLDPKMTLYINTMMIWVGFSGTMLAAPAYPEKFLLAGSLSWDTAVVNGLGGHVAPAAASVSYNPGLVQSLVMVPLGIFIIRASGRPWLCLANGLGAHIIAFGVGINLMYRAGLPEAPAMIVFDLLGGLALPLGLSTMPSIRTRPTNTSITLSSDVLVRAGGVSRVTRLHLHARLV